MWISKWKYETLLMRIEHLQNQCNNLEKATRFFDSQHNHVEIKYALQAVVDHLDLKLSMLHQEPVILVATRNG